jgi:hypothetical protein
VLCRADKADVFLLLSVIGRDFVKTKKGRSGIGRKLRQLEKSGMIGGEKRRVAVENPGNIRVALEFLIEKPPDFLA